jgi:hypothetical protein
VIASHRAELFIRTDDSLRAERVSGRMALARALAASRGYHRGCHD